MNDIKKMNVITNILSYYKMNESFHLKNKTNSMNYSQTSESFLFFVLLCK